MPGGISDGVTAGAGKTVAFGCGFAGAPMGGGVGGGGAAAAGVTNGPPAAITATRRPPPARAGQGLFTFTRRVFERLGGGTSHPTGRQPASRTSAKAPLVTSDIMLRL